MDSRLLKAVGSLGTQAQVEEVLRLARAALDDLSQLDEGLYERFVEQRTAPLPPEALSASLRWLWDDTFGGLMALLDYCRGLETAATAPAPDAGGGLDFDFGDLESGGESSSELSLGAGDIGDLLDNIDEQLGGGADERWGRVCERLLSLEYGLRSQQTDAVERRDVALTAGQAEPVLGLLDDTQSSASEGVHAVVSAIYEAFVPDTDPSTLVPGYLTTLGRALLVRRGLSSLAQTLGPLNEALQGTPTEQDLETVRTTMKAFVGSVVCRAMRPGDRWQMVEFERELAEQPLAVARVTSEGLVKYLDSLSSVNQREVLLRHDERILEELRESLSSARQLLEISPRTATEMLERSSRLVHELRGRLAATDFLLDALGGPLGDGHEALMARLAELEAFLAASGG